MEVNSVVIIATSIAVLWSYKQEPVFVIFVHLLLLEWNDEHGEEWMEEMERGSEFCMTFHSLTLMSISSKIS